METIRLGPLSAVISSDHPGEEVQMTVVLLHGFGAPATDLVGLAPALRPLAGVRFVFPAGPIGLTEFGTIPGGRAWWPIDMVRLHVARMTGESDVLAQEVPEGLAEARQALGEALSELSSRYAVTPNRLVLGGFSQGAMLSCDYALRAKQPPLGLVQLSGTVICEPEWKQLLPERAGLPVLQSHSPDDDILPMSMAERLAQLMQAAGLDHEFVAFRGGHGIPHGVMARLKSFLEARLASLPKGQTEHEEADKHG